MTKTIQVATTECAARVERFAAGLRQLCADCALEVQIDSGLWLVDTKRAGYAHPNWPFVASIELPRMDVELSTIIEPDFPEDYAELSAARAEEREW